MGTFLREMKSFIGNASCLIIHKQIEGWEGPLNFHRCFQFRLDKADPNPQISRYTLAVSNRPYGDRFHQGLSTLPSPGSTWNSFNSCIRCRGNQFPNLLLSQPHSSLFQYYATVHFNSSAGSCCEATVSNRLQAPPVYPKLHCSSISELPLETALPNPSLL